MALVWLHSYEIEQVGHENPGLGSRDGEQKKPGIQSRASFMVIQLERQAESKLDIAAFVRNASEQFMRWRHTSPG
jgi:hypothetical protein